MMHVGLDLSRKRLDVCVLDDAGQNKLVTACPPDADGLQHLVVSLDRLGGPIQAAIESMNGARFAHDTLELAGWSSRGGTWFRPSGFRPQGSGPNGSGPASASTWTG